MNWLFWQTGAAPFVGGGFGHFYHYAPFPQEYPIDRYTMETKRQLDLLDKHLADNAYINGDEYTIADMAIWPWYGRLVQGELYGDAVEFLQAEEYTQLKAWADKIAERPAVKRALEAEYKEIN
jgi:GST-like protein